MARYKHYDLLGNQYQRIGDPTTGETERIEGAQVEFYDDFNFTTIWTTTEHGPWLKKDTSVVGATVEDILANQSGGVATLALDAQAEKQEAGIYFGDALTFNLDKGVVFEARVAIHTAPTDEAEIYFGLANAYVEGPIAAADAGPTVHALFMFDGALTPTLHTDDASTDNNAIATGVTEVLDTYSVFRIDASNLSSVKFFIDGARVAASTTFVMTNGTNVCVQPFLICHKEAGAGLGVVYVDYVRVWQLSR